MAGRGGEANFERVLEIGPDLIFDFGSVRDTYIVLASGCRVKPGSPMS